MKLARKLGPAPFQPVTTGPRVPTGPRQDQGTPTISPYSIQTLPPAGVDGPALPPAQRPDDPRAPVRGNPASPAQPKPGDPRKA